MNPRGFKPRSGLIFPKAFFPVGKKGFNLFTALVSFLLIMLAVLLIQSMIQTERNAADTIAKIESRSRLEATAEMARADALQVFNYGLRKKIEEWLTDPERGGLTLNLQDQTWEEIQREFAESKFGGQQGSQFAKFTASSLEGIFYSPAHFGNYTISLEGSYTFEDGLTKAIEKSLDDFFTVIECPDGIPTTCEKGTFYVNLHIERLSQEEYEKLPKLHVVDRATGEELKEIVLPRTTFRIYVPLRFFKAIAEAKAITHFPLSAQPNTPSDQGLFSPRVHNEIEQMGLGMCDFGSCAPRQSPLQAPQNNVLDYDGSFCPGDNTSPNWGKGLATKLDCGNFPWCSNYVLPTSYNANNNDDWKDMRDSLSLVGKARVCEVLKEARRSGLIDAMANDDFSLMGSECEEGGEMLAYEISINADARDSKRIGTGDAMSQASDPGRSLGLFLNSGEVDFPHIGVADLACSDEGTGPKSRCAEVKSVKVTLAFREENTDYMVGEAKQGEERVYRISLYDNTYVPFTGNWTQGSIGSDSLFSSAPTRTDCSMAEGQGWHCVTNSAAGGTVGGEPRTIGCVPG